MKSRQINVSISNLPGVITSVVREYYGNMKANYYDVEVLTLFNTAQKEYCIEFYGSPEDLIGRPVRNYTRARNFGSLLDWNDEEIKSPYKYHPYTDQPGPGYFTEIEA